MFMLHRQIHTSIFKRRKNSRFSTFFNITGTCWHTYCFHKE